MTLGAMPMFSNKMTVTPGAMAMFSNKMTATPGAMALIPNKMTATPGWMALYQFPRTQPLEDLSESATYQPAGVDAFIIEREMRKLFSSRACCKAEKMEEIE